ncbi:Rpn family recombination-promoting nuclease/putative transposase [Nitrosococcus oceani]|uniref:Rpn family recombination-promoting nuclease/putative transposase n=1 Tax=Nitrosococcus oceani TaxID=1229 RepID=UPI0004E8A9E1|nr:Rpn family recombination-promoting nuclease/putative transposase [Nitrosococcus oceani]KFI22576.1 transposase [Nitrosococcus oceani]
MAAHDASYKRLFSHPEMVRDLLQGFVREPWVQQLDFSTLEKVSGSYVTDDLREREDDIIWRLRHQEGWMYIYLLLEFQSTVDPYMAVRVLTYVGLLYQDLIKARYIAPNQKLPPVFPLVLYNGGPRWRAATEVGDLITPLEGGLERYRPSLRYLLVDEGDYQDEALAPLKNLVASLFRLENSRTPEDLLQVLRNLLQWLQSPAQKGLERDFTLWLKRVLLPARLPGVEIPSVASLEEMNSMLAERVVEWTQQWKQQGIQEGIKEGIQQGIQEGIQQGIQEGIQQGEVQVLRRLLARRFGSLPEWVEARLQAADTAALEEWAERVLEAATLDEVFQEKP